MGEWCQAVWNYRDKSRITLSFSTSKHHNNQHVCNTDLAVVNTGLHAVSHIKFWVPLSSVGSWWCPLAPGTATHQFHFMTVNRWIQSWYVQHIHDGQRIHLLASATCCYTSLKFLNTLHNYQLVHVFIQVNSHPSEQGGAELSWNAWCPSSPETARYLTCIFTTIKEKMII